MYIELAGLSGVKIQTGENTVLLAPPAKDGERKASRMKADVAVLGHPSDQINVEPRNEKLFTISGPGEYEIGGVFVYCSAHTVNGAVISLISHISAEGMTIAHLGSLRADLTPEQLELFEGADILLIPVGGTTVLDAKQAISLLEKIEPRIVIPMHFEQPGLKTKLDTIQTFLKAAGSNAQPQERFKIAKKDLPQETMEIVHLKS